MGVVREHLWLGIKIGLSVGAVMWLIIITIAGKSNPDQIERVLKWSGILIGSIIAGTTIIGLVKKVHQKNNM